jgi:lipoprotein-releasing system permease protein
MMLKRWIGFVSIRWFGASRENGGSASSLLAASGIAIGVAALVVVLGVMNGFQLGYINSILDVSSFHVRVDDERVFSGTPSAGPDEALISHIAAESGAASVVPFVETRCLISSNGGRPFPLVVRAMPEDAPKRDPEMMKALGMEATLPMEAWPGRGGIFLGAELARYLDVKPGSDVDLLVVSGGTEGIEAKTIKMRIGGLFRSGYYDFDFGMAVMPFSAANSIFPSGEPVQFVYGVKLRDRNTDALFCERLRADLGLGPDRV